MGFLDHSTNNIIVDAVLTDLGRQALSRNDGSFSIFQFALGDDEIDYSVIQKFGRTVGKEKIEKNTPIMEALTAGSLALKHKLVSIDNEFVTHFPLLTMRTNNTTDLATDGTTFRRGSQSGTDKTKTITIEIAAAAGTPEIDEQLVDSSFRVEINNLFLRIDNNSADIIYTDNISVYEVAATPGDANIAAQGAFNLTLKEMTDTTFNLYSSTGGSAIKTFVKVTGINSGLTKNFQVTINRNSNS